MFFDDEDPTQTDGGTAMPPMGDEDDEKEGGESTDGGVM